MIIGYVHNCPAPSFTKTDLKQGVVWQCDYEGCGRRWCAQPDRDWAGPVEARPLRWVLLAPDILVEPIQ